MRHCKICARFTWDPVVCENTHCGCDCDLCLCPVCGYNTIDVERINMTEYNRLYCCNQCEWDMKGKGGKCQNPTCWNSPDYRSDDEMEW